MTHRVTYEEACTHQPWWKLALMVPLVLLGVPWRRGYEWLLTYEVRDE